MTRFASALLSSMGICFCASGIIREVTYEWSGRRVPTFDKGYLLTAESDCQIAVYGPKGRLAFRQLLAGPKGEPCSMGSTAVDRDGSSAASISYSTSAGYRAGIVRMNPRGEKTSFIETGLYLPSHICFDSEHSIWSIGWQRDGIRNDSEDSQDYPIVRRYSASGREIGAFLPRSLWSRKAVPGAAQRGHWKIASAENRIGAIVNDNHANVDAEWIEWDLQGKLLSRTKLTENLSGGFAYTADGQLYLRRITREPGRQGDLMVLDRATASWMLRRQWPDASGFLLGADGKDLVFATSALGPYRLVWVATE